VVAEAAGASETSRAPLDSPAAESDEKRAPRQAGPGVDESAASLSEIMRQAEEVLRLLPDDMRASLARRPGGFNVRRGGGGGGGGSVGSSLASSAPLLPRPAAVAGRADAGGGRLGSVGSSVDTEAATAGLAAIAAAADARQPSRAPPPATAAAAPGGGGRGGGGGGSVSVSSSGVLSEGAASVVRELRALEMQLGLKVGLTGQRRSRLAAFVRACSIDSRASGS
jgi:hypothetical protein